MKQSFVKRYEKNPILTKDDVPYKVETVHNAAVAKYDGKYIMLFRSHLDTGRSIIGIAQSDDGFNFTVSDKPFMTPATEMPFAEYEAFGVEDPHHAAGRGLLYYIQRILKAWRPHRSCSNN